VRLRALVPLLVLTGMDYALWDWSIADGHDIVSLVAGLTLLPLAAVSLGALALVGARFLRFLLGSSSALARARTSARKASVPGHTTTTPATEQDSSSSRLAA
jgi:hypothetical protein